MELGSKYIRYSKIASMGVSIPLIFLFTYLVIIGAATTDGVSYTENCAGTLHEPCYLFWNVTMNKTVYIQANESWFDTEPPISKLILKRKWGSYWRTIDLTKSWSSRVKYALKLNKGQSYEFMFIAYKEDPRDVIEWNVNPIGVWDKALAKETCDYKIIYWNETKIYFKIVEHYNEKNGTYWNETVLDYKEIVELSRKECILDTERIEYAEYFLDYGEELMGCSIMDNTIICDLAYTGDANGDGICQSGETCATYILTDKIELDEIKNGVVDVLERVSVEEEVLRK